MKQVLRHFRNNPAEAGIFFIFLFLASALNLQYVSGGNVHTAIAGHDEYLTVREVYSILHPLSLKHFVMAIISGDVLYYGRIVFYSDALFAFLPEKIAGIAGMVFAIRMTHFLFLISGIWILASSFVGNAKIRVILLVSAMLCYFSFYFTMMPKPEPFQLFFLALFMRAFVKNNYSFGWYFLFAGIAYGIKFNLRGEGRRAAGLRGPAVVEAVLSLRG